MAVSTSAKSRTRLTRERSRAQIIEAATELVRVRSYAQLNVGEIMDRAGIGRTIFYRHFDDLADLLLSAGREAIEELYEAQTALTATGVTDADAIYRAIALAVGVYERHGPILRAVAEAAGSDELVAPGQEALRARFDALVADALREIEGRGETRFADIGETARALNLLNTAYLLDAFGREPRVSADTAIRTLTEIWVSFIN